MSESLNAEPTTFSTLNSVSPSAVSRQIAALESYLDVRLFHRARDGNVLTEAGEEYYRGIAPAFETITSVTDRVKRAQDSAPLNVRVPSTFAVRFLIPRLSEFGTEHPGISVRMVTGFGAVDFVREDVEEAILRLAGDEEMRAEFARRAVEAYRAEFTLERMEEAYMDLYLRRM